MKPHDPTRPTSTSRDLSEQSIHHAVGCLISAVAHLRASGESSLTGYSIALLRRVQSTVADGGYQARPDAQARWKMRHDLQRRGLDVAVAKLDAWEKSPTATLADLADLVRDVYVTGVNAGIDSILPEFADISLPASQS